MPRKYVKLPLEVTAARCIVCDAPIVRKARAARYCAACRPFANKVAQAVHLHIRRLVIQGKLKPAINYACVDCGKRAHVFDHRKYGERDKFAPVCWECDFKRGAAEDIKELTLKMMENRAYTNDGEI